ncbi:MAG TPA: low molecular weight phosphatase family protein [Anaerolineae bacterium]|nr:low molecular weight phosphatase family protein [Anaerolineae bacterium]
MSEKKPARGRETKTVMFLCTGNYYRSRFAEELFNHLAAEAGLEWQAVSRGIATELGLHNVGPISTHALMGLEQRGIAARGHERFPAQLREEELALADRVIALKEAEHRPLLLARFPGWAGRVEYWHVDDLEDTPPLQAVPEMERNVADLIRRLGADNGDGAKR